MSYILCEWMYLCDPKDYEFTAELTEGPREFTTELILMVESSMRSLSLIIQV